MFYILFTTLIISFQVLAAKEDCRDKAYQLLSDETDKVLFNRHPYLHSFLDCDSPSFHIHVVIHEATHFEDLGIPPYLTEETFKKLSENENFKINFNLYALNGERRGEIKLTNLPFPRDLILKFLSTHYPEVLHNDAHTIQSKLEGYLYDPETLASYSFTQGLVTELNSYVRSHKLETETGHSFNQRYGVLGFIFFFKAYLYQLKQDHPSLWSEFTNNEFNRNYLNNLFQDALKVLDDSSYCEEMDAFEQRDLHPLVSDPFFSGPLTEFLSNPEIFDDISCHHAPQK